MCTRRHTQSNHYISPPFLHSSSCYLTLGATTTRRSSWSLPTCLKRLLAPLQRGSATPVVPVYWVCPSPERNAPARKTWSVRVFTRCWRRAAKACSPCPCNGLEILFIQMHTAWPGLIGFTMQWSLSWFWSVFSVGKEREPAKFRI